MLCGVPLRDLVPSSIGALVRRGADFASAEDAVQDALVVALRTWPDDPPRDPQAWLITAAWHRFIDAARSTTARRAREVADVRSRAVGVDAEASRDVAASDDTLDLYFLCAHPSLSASAAVALTLRAVGGLTTRQIAAAFLVPEATMGQRISRAKRRISEVHLGERGEVSTVCRVLYLVFTAGYDGDVDLAAEAIRLTRRLAGLSDDPEVHGLLALMLLHHARRGSRTDPQGRLIPLGEQDRTSWDTRLIEEGIEILVAALARDALGEYQAQAAIAALHVDAPDAASTDWVQIVEWYDELLRITDSPVVRLNRAVAVGEADGAAAGLAALALVPPHVPRRIAVEAHLRERAGERAAAADLYTLAAAAAANTAERNHLMRSVAPSAWTHLRIELDGTTAEVFVGDATEPDLTVSDLKLGADASGGVGLWVDQGSVATFANLTVTQG